MDNGLNMKRSTSRLMMVIIMLVIVVIGGTFAWFTYQTKKSALVLTIGNLNDTHITLTPYQINEVMAPGNNYTSGVHSDVNVQVGNGIQNSSVVLYYKINDLDTTLINKGLSYTVVDSDGNSVASGKFKDLIDTSKELPEEVVIFNTKATNEDYSVYIWVDSSVGNQNDIQNTTLDIELNASIGRIVISGTPMFKQKLETSMTDMNTEATYSYQWYSNATNSVSGGTPISGATSSSYTIGSGHVGRYIYVEVTVSDPKQGTKTYSDITSVIQPITSVINLTSTSKIYDGNVLNSNAGTTNSDKPILYTYHTDPNCTALTTNSANGSASDGAAPIDAGNYYVKARVEAGDYSATSVCIPHTISKKQLSVTWDNSTTTLVYSGVGQAPSASVMTGVNSPSESMTLSRTLSTDVGSYTSTASCNAVTGGRGKCANYVLVDTTKDFSIVQKQLTVSISAQNKVYDSNTTAQCVIGLSGAVASEEPTASATGTFSNANVGNSKTVNCTSITLDNATWRKNYSLNKTEGSTTANITQKEITVTWGSTTSWVYDGQSHLPTVTTPVSGAGSEKLNLTVSGAQTNVGDYTATTSCSSVTGGQALCSNYSLKNPTLGFSITKATNPISVTTPQSWSTTYSTSEQTKTITAATGGVGTVSYAIQSQKNSGGTAISSFSISGTTLKMAAGTNAGTYTVVIRATAAGSSNYNSGYKDITMNVTVAKATGSCSVKVTGTNTYNQTLTATITTVSDGLKGYKWYSNSSNSASGGAAISNATAQTYKIGSGLVGKYIYVAASVAEGTNYTAATCTDITDATENETATVAKADNPLTVTTPQTWAATYSTSAQTTTITAATGGVGTVSYAIQSQKNSSGTSVSYFSISGTTLTMAKNTPVSGSTYTLVIRVSASGNGDYNGIYKDITMNVTVAKADNPISVTASQSWSTTYSSNDQTKSITAATGGVGTVSYKVQSQKNSGGTAVSSFSVDGTTLTMKGGTNAGTYTVVIRATAAGDSNYNSGYKDITMTVTVARATGSCTVKITGKNTYDQTLTATITTSSNGTKSYKWYSNSSNSASGGTAISNATAQTYKIGNGLIGKYIYVSASVAEGTNYTAATCTDITDSTENTTSTVSKAANPISVTASQSWSTTYSTSVQTKSITAATGGVGTVSYEIQSQKNSSGTAVSFFTLDGTILGMGSGTTAGTYTVVIRASATGDSNHNSGYKDITMTVTIAKADNPIGVTPNQSWSTIFSTSEQTKAITVATGGIGTVSYSVQSQKNKSGTAVSYFSMDGSTLKMAASTPVTGSQYIVVIRATAAGNENYKSGSKDITMTVTISKATGSCTVKITGKNTYNQTLTATITTSSNGTKGYKWYSNSSNSASGGATLDTTTQKYTIGNGLVGKYIYVAARVEEGSNYTAATCSDITDATNNTTATVAKASNPGSVITPQTWSIPYSTSAKTTTITAMTGAVGTVSYAIQSQKNSGGTAVSNFSISGTTLTMAKETLPDTYTVVIRATAAGDSNHNSGYKDITMNVTVEKLDNPITITGTQTWSTEFNTSAQTKTITAATNAQGTVSYKIKSQKNKSGTAVSYFSISGTTLTMAKNTPVSGSSYSVIITATAAGNEIYKSGSVDTTMTVTVVKRPGSCTVKITGTNTYNQQLTATITTSSNGTKGYNWYSNSSNSVSGGTSLSTTTQKYTIGNGLVGKYIYVSASVAEGSNYTAATCSDITDATNNTTATVAKASNPGSVTTPQTWSIPYSTSAKTTTITAMTGAAGTVSYAIQSQKNSSETAVSNFSISGTTLTMAKETLPDTYKVVIRATAAGDSNHNSGYKDITMNVTVEKLDNPITITGTQTWSTKFNTSAQTKTITAATNAQGTVSYKIKSQKNVSGTAVSYFSISGTTLTMAKNTPVSGSSYSVIITATAAGNEIYKSGSVNTTMTVTVGRATGSCTVKITGTNTYNQQLTATITTSSDGTKGYKWYSNSSNSASGGNEISNATSQKYTIGSGLVGKYIYVSASVAQGSNYTAATCTDITDATNNTTATVAKASNPISVTTPQSWVQIFSPSQDKTKTITAATNAAGTVSYTIKSQVNSSETAVSYFTLDGTTLTMRGATPMDTYTVVIRATAAGDSNHNSGYKDIKVEVVVDKLDNPITGESSQSWSTTYSTSEQTKTITAVTDAQGTVSYAIQSQKNSSGTAVSSFSISGTTLKIAAGTNAGTYTVVVRATAAGNTTYKSGYFDITVNVTVGRAAGSCTVKITGTNTYKQQLTATITTSSDGTKGYKWYSNSSNSASGGNEISNATSQKYTIGSGLAGKYIYVSASVAQGTNYTAATCTDITDATNNTTATVAMALNPISVTTPQSWVTTYSTSEQTKTITPASGAVGQVSYTIKSQVNSSETAVSKFSISGTTLKMAAGTSNGTYKVVITARSPGSSDYLPGAKDITVNVNVGKAPNPISVTTPQSWSTTYSTSEQTKTITPASGAVGQVNYTIKSQVNSSETTVSNFILDGTTLKMAARTNAGTYKVVITAYTAGGGSYTAGSKDITVNVTVGRAAGSCTVKITGTNTYNQQLTATITTVSDGTKGYKWYSNSSNSASGGNEISNATSQKYTIGSGLAGKYIYVSASVAQGTNYTAATCTDITDATNNTTATVEKADNPFNGPVKASWLATYSTSEQINDTIVQDDALGTISYSVRSQKTVSGVEVSYFNILYRPDAVLAMNPNTPVDSYAVAIDISSSGDADHKSGVRTITMVVGVYRADNPISVVNSSVNWNTTYSTSAQKTSYPSAVNGEGTVTYAIQSQQNASKVAVSYFTLNGEKLEMAASTPVAIYTVVIRATAAGNGNYESGYVDITYTITVRQADNPLTVTTPQSWSAIYSASNQTKTITPATGGVGTVSYAIKSQKNSSGTAVSNFSISGTTLTMKGGVSLDTYTVVINVTATGDSNYKTVLKEIEMIVVVSDSEEPTCTSLVATSSGTSVTATLNGCSDVGTGISKYQYTIVSSTASCAGYTDSSNSTYTWDGKADGTYKVCARVYDGANNYNDYSTTVTVVNNTLVNHITNLYNASTLSTVTQNNVTYYRDTTNLIMNDGLGLGGVSEATEGNLRYYGSNPNNYIKFNCDVYPSTNCEIWRIIGVFDVDNSRKVKLIRVGHIGEYSWDTRSDPDDSTSWHGYNDWTEASLMKLLNGGYTGAGGSLYYNAGSGKCLGLQGATQYNCNFTSTGLKNAVTRNLVSYTSHYLGGFEIDGADFYHYVNEFYLQERSDSVYPGNYESWLGKVALAYPSDYGYGADLSSCNHLLGNYDYCKNNNWMFNILGKGEAVYHLLTPNNDENWHVAYVQGDGKMGSGSATYFNQRIVPTVYLDENTLINGGSGTSSDPYILDVKVVYGDANLDGVVDQSDTTLVSGHANGSVTLSGDALVNSDVNSDGVVDSNDATLILQYVNGETYELPKRGVLYGDIDLNGTVNQRDVLMALLYSASLNTFSLPEASVINTDVNLDGNINSADAMLILRYVNGEINSLPVSSVAAPVLDSGMIPVKIANDGTVTTVSSTDSSWHNYDNKEWANVVLVKSSGTKTRDYYKSNTGVTVAESDILAYYVWIPRYRYKIWTLTESSTGQEQTIDIVFESADAPITQGSQVGDYITHPAFIWDGEPVAGIWVGKFEPGHSTDKKSTTKNNLGCINENCSNADGLIIKPNVVSLGNNNVSNMFYASRSMTRSGNPFGMNSSTTDSHMTKNSEWGAVAYLSHSKYGIINKLRKNNNTDWITGCGAKETTTGSISICQIKYGSGVSSYPQSTTGNITGVFDIAGGRSELVMGVLSDSTGKPLSGGNSSNNSGFNGLFGVGGAYSSGTNFPDSKYYDLYLSSRFTAESSIQTPYNMSLCTLEVCGGHALHETAYWYGGGVTGLNFPLPDNPWFERGGFYSGGAGQFFSANATGGAIREYTWRSVLVVN